MKILKWCFKSIFDLIKFPFSGVKNFSFFILSLPAIFALFLAAVFVTDLVNPFVYGQEKDKDNTAPKVEQETIYLEQGWEQGYREKYYFTPQGSHIIPLDMALALESPNSENLIFGEQGTAITQFGYMDYPETKPASWKEQDPDNRGKNRNKGNGPNTYNPYGLPIGFTRDKDRQGNSMLGINCAGCHASNMTIGGKSVRIDGGAALGDFMGLLEEIDTGLVVTLGDEQKLARYAERIGKDLETAQAELQVVSMKRQGWQRRNKTDFPHGFARVDAFGIIFNQVVGRDLNLDTKDELGNVRTPQAPASYPVLWDTPFMGRVQWTGGSNNLVPTDPLARNIGQVLGVFGSVEMTTQSSLPGFCSTPKRKNLDLYNFWLRSLKSPKWDDPALDGILPALDPALLARGEAIYTGEALEGRNGAPTQGCSGCHAMVSDALRDKDPAEKKVCDVPFRMISHDLVQTDRELIDTGRRKGAKTGRLAGQDSKLFPGKKLKAEEDYMVMLGEMIMGSFAGAYLSGSCDGNWSLGNLVETANTYGHFAKLGAKDAAQKERLRESNKNRGGELTSGGFALPVDDVESAQTNWNTAKDILARIPTGAELPEDSISLAGDNIALAKANHKKANDNLDFDPGDVFMPPADPTQFQIEVKSAENNLKRAREIVARSKVDSTLSPEQELLQLSNLKMAEENLRQAVKNTNPILTYKAEECPDAGKYSAYAYKARPLNGIWAAAPYLHNGSVPTLYDMLLPPVNEEGVCEADECRPTQFQVGSTEFDPVKVGFVTEEGAMSSLFDTTLKGNSNAGHTFFQDQLSPEDRMALIEYLKSL